MISLSGNSRIIQKSDDLVEFSRNPVRKVMFLFLFLLLGISFVLGIDPESDLSGPELLRTIGYAAVLLVLLGAAGWSSMMKFDRSAGKIESVVSIFGFAVKRQSLARMENITGVVLQKASLFHDDASRGMRSGVFGNLFEPRSQLLRLYLDTDESRIPLDEGGDSGRLEAAGVFFSKYLDVEFSKVELESET